MRSRSYSICPLCNKEISNSNIKKHLDSHKKHPEYHEQPKHSVKHDGIVCQYCGKECKNTNSLCNHERLCSKNPLKQHSNLSKYHTVGQVAWNAGLTKETDERVRKYTETRNLHYAEGLFKLPKQVPSENAYCTRYKYGWYRGYYCDSSWELAFIMYHLDHDIPIYRNKTSFEYVDSKGKLRNFYPDFVVNGDTFVEIKGGHDLEQTNKRTCMPQEVKFVWIDHEGIKKFIQYATHVYGKDFIQLYDSDKPNWMHTVK